MACCLLASAFAGQKRNIDEAAIKLDAQTANLVSSLLRNSAERAAANAPIIINRDSQLFKKYQQQRLPRRADPHNKVSIFREDIEQITPKPYGYDGSTEYKPSTTEAPELNSNEIHLDSQFEFESAGQPVASLEEQLNHQDSNYEALRLPEPHHISKLPPIDSDLYSDSLPFSDSLSQLSPDSTYDHHSLAGTFVRPRPNQDYNSRFPNFPSSSLYPSSTTENSGKFKTDFGYKVLPKPTEAVKILPLVTQPIRPYIAPTTTTTTTTTSTTTTPIIIIQKPTRPIIFHEESYEPLTVPVTVAHHDPIVSHESFANPGYQNNVHYKINSDLLKRPEKLQPEINPIKFQYETYTKKPITPEPVKVFHEPEYSTKPSVKPAEVPVKNQNYQTYQKPEYPVKFQAETYTKKPIISEQPVKFHEPNYQKPEEPFVVQEPYVVHNEPVHHNYPTFEVQEEVYHEKPREHFYESDQYESPSVIHHVQEEHYKRPPSRPQQIHQVAATTPHPLVFGFKPVASFVSSTLEGVFGSPASGPKRNRPNNGRPNHNNKPPPQAFNFRQPKFFHRQPYQQQSKPVRFPLGFFYT